MVGDVATWLTLGALGVLGGHMDAVGPGARVVFRTEGMRSLAAVLETSHTADRNYLHTDGSFSPCPPEYVIFYFRRPCGAGGGAVPLHDR